jgi:hypothetical protein
LNTYPQGDIDTARVDPTYNALLMRNMLKPIRINAATDAQDSNGLGVGAIAGKDAGGITILLFNHQGTQSTGYTAHLTVSHLPPEFGQGPIHWERYLADETHSNIAFNGSRDALEKVEDGALNAGTTVTQDVALARNSVTLIVLTPSQAPGGQKNLVSGMMPTASYPGGNLAVLTDGDLNTDHYAGLGATGPQWVKFDLGQTYTLSDIKLWHYYGDGRTYHGVIAQISNTVDFSTGVTTVFNNDRSNSEGQGAGSDTEYAETAAGKDIPFNPVNARYVRLWSNGSSANAWSHYVEVEVFGSGVPPVTPPGPNNLASGIMPTASHAGDNLAVLTDGDLNTQHFAGLSATGPQWVKFDLGQTYTLSDIKLWHYYGDGRTYHGVIAQVSNSVDFSAGVTTVFNNDWSNSEGQGAGSDAEYAETASGKDIPFNPVNARYVRLWSSGNSVNGWSHYVEVEVFGSSAPPVTPPGTSNLALNILPAASSLVDHPAAATDGDLSSANYAGLNGSGSQWVKIDLGRPYVLNEIKLWHFYADARTYHDVVAQVSNSADFSTGVTTVFNNDRANHNGQGAGSDAEYAETAAGKDISFNPVNARYVRLWSNGSSVNVWNHYVEVEIFGSTVTANSSPAVCPAPRHTAVRSIEKAALDYLGRRNQDLKPFVWRADADLILGKVALLSERNSDSGH